MATQLDLAEHQLTGFKHAKEGYSLRDLISSMGLTKREWDTLQNKEKVDYLNKDDKEEIDEYFESEAKSKHTP